MSKSILTQSYLKECFDYDPESGALTWKRRPRDHFTTPIAAAAWNVRWAGKNAGSPHSDGYLQIRVGNKKYLSHRVIWCLIVGEFPDNQLDHINHIRSDNRWINLREATHQENGRNQSISSRNTSGAVGVYRHKLTGKWQADIRYEGKNIYLGRFEDWFESVCARKSAEVRYGFHENHGKRRYL